MCPRSTRSFKTLGTKKVSSDGVQSQDGTGGVERERGKGTESFQSWSIVSSGENME